MKKYKDFKEIMEDMISPLENPDFYGLILTSHNAAYGGIGEVTGYSLCHEYNLGSTTYEIYQKLMRIALMTYINNVDEHVYNASGRKNSYSEVKGYFKTILDSSNPEENVKSFFSESSNKKFLEETLGTLTDGFGRGFFYFKSHYLEPNKITDAIHSDNVKHRLYLTVDNECRAEMAQKIIEKCEDKSIPYNFKVFISPKKYQVNQQSDTMVLYLENEKQVVDYVNLINEIVQENPNIAEHIYRPSAHLGKINEYVGYGFEPKMKIAHTNVSYSGFMAKVVNDACNITRKFSSAAQGILKSIYENDISYSMIARDYSFRNPSCSNESLYIPTKEECEEMLKYDDRKEKDPEVTFRMKAKIRSTISTFYRIMRKNDRKNFPKIEEALKYSLVKNSHGMPHEMFGMDDVEILCINNEIAGDNGEFDEDDI